jgi:TPR repeat protein/putative methionine-R-sulfoxide reductase with GAF domain
LHEPEVGRHQTACFQGDPPNPSIPDLNFALSIFSAHIFLQSGVNIYSPDSGPLMAASVQAPIPPSSNRRARVRQKVHVPAYATFSGVLSGESHDLCEILNISEIGLAVQSSSSMHVDQTVDLCLHLAEADGEIPVLARVAWFNDAGPVGFHLSVPDDLAKERLREWLLLNALAAVANAEAEANPKVIDHSPPKESFTDVLNAATAIQREAESLGTDLEAVLALVASRARTLLRSSGAAVALAGKDADTMTCRASAGESAPPVGASLHVGSGFSGECVRSEKVLCCNDSDTDDRVDRDTCRALGIRSVLAAPLRSAEKTIGLMEVFSPQPGNYRDSDNAILQRLADTISAAIFRALAVHTPTQPPEPPKPFIAPPGSVLFASYAAEKSAEVKNEKNKNEAKNASSSQDKDKDRDIVGGIRLPRTHLILLISAAVTIFFALGFLSAPWLQLWIQARVQAHAQTTVLASTQPPSESAVPKPSADTASLPQLRQLAAQGDAAAENALGLLYSTGDDKQKVLRNENDAARWFMKAAEHGNVSAQSKLGSLYWGGRGVPQDPNRAYFWTVLARASGDDASKVLAPFIATHLTSPQRTAIEQQAEQWLQQHETRASGQSLGTSLK